MKHINLLTAIIFFLIFDYEIHAHVSEHPWNWFCVGLLNLAEWIRCSITREIKEYIDKIKQ